MMLYLNRVTTDHCHPPMSMHAKGQVVLRFSCCNEEKPACRCITLVQGISVLLHKLFECGYSD